MLQSIDRLRYCFVSPWRAKVPVVSVGNLTAGGTGKTVLVDYLCDLLKGSLTLAIVSRGYRADSSGMNDEMKLLQHKHPELILESSVKRQDAIERSTERGSDFVVMDDGFQHRSVWRDLDIVILDASDPYSKDYLPRGRRREPIHSLQRADIIVLSHADRISAEQLAQLKEELRKQFNKVVVAGRHVLSLPKNISGDILQACPIYLLAGIGSPQHFEASLKDKGFEIKEKMILGDHKAPSEKQQRTLESTQLPIVCTQKDHIKCPTRPWYVAEVKWEFIEVSDKDLFEENVKKVMKKHA